MAIGLGTDVAGGASPSLLHQAHDAVTVSRLLADGVDPNRPASERGVPGSAIDTTLAFWLATLGGANVLRAPVGLLEPGRRFDAVLVDTASRRGSLRVWPDIDTPARVFEKVVRLAGPSDIVGVWVDGRQVFRRRVDPIDARLERLILVRTFRLDRTRLLRLCRYSNLRIRRDHRQADST